MIQVLLPNQRYLVTPSNLSPVLNTMISVRTAHTHSPLNAQYSQSARLISNEKPTLPTQIITLYLISDSENIPVLIGQIWLDVNNVSAHLSATLYMFETIRAFRIGHITLQMVLFLRLKFSTRRHQHHRF